MSPSESNLLLKPSTSIKKYSNCRSGIPPDKRISGQLRVPTIVALSELSLFMISPGTLGIILEKRPLVILKNGSKRSKLMEMRPCKCCWLGTRLIWSLKDRYRLKKGELSPRNRDWILSRSAPRTTKKYRELSTFWHRIYLNCSKTVIFPNRPLA